MSVKATGQLPQGAVKVIEGWSRQSGDYTDYIYRGTKGQMGMQYATLRGFVDEVERQQNGLSWEVRARIARTAIESGGEVPVDEVRLTYNKVAKDILEHPAFADCTGSQMRELRRALDDYTIPLPIDLPNEAMVIALLADKGVKHFRVDQPVLQFLRTASGAYEFTVSYSNVGKILTTTQVKAENGINGLLKVALPDDTSNRDGFAYGWLKNYPEYQPGSNGRYVFSQDYEYGLWPTAMYPLAT